MSSRHAKSATGSAETRTRPFDALIVGQADTLADRYEITVEANGSGFVGTVASLPTVFGCGTSRQAARDNARDHLKWALAYMIETGRTPTPDH